MLFHCDALTTRWASRKFRWLTNAVNFETIPQDYVYELAILLATPGLRDVDLRNWFERKLQIRTIRYVKRLGLEVAEQAQENAESVTEADAWAMLALTPLRSSPALWARALVFEKGEGVVAKRLGVRVADVKRWKHANGGSATTAL